MANGTGSATLNFGAAPGTNHATITVTGQVGITSASFVEAWLQGNDSTADHNGYEHKFLSNYIGFAADNLIAGTGFDINAFTELRLRGLLTVRWVWST
jgi:hypothetical protein